MRCARPAQAQLSQRSGEHFATRRCRTGALVLPLTPCLRADASPAAFDALVPEAETAVFVAVSGGADSTLLAWCAADWARRRGRPPPRLVHVDHRWSGDGAFVPVVERLARHLDLELTVLRAPDPVTPQETAARHMRHRALARHVTAQSRAGRHPGVLALGHTATDRAETLAMRLARGSGALGLAVMPARGPSPVWPEGRSLNIIRPLASLERQAVRERLARMSGVLWPGLEWQDDPANADPRHERVRWRMALGDLAPFLDLAVQAARFREVMTGLARGLAVSEAEPGVLVAELSALGGLPVEARALWLDRAISAASGRAGGPRGQALSRLSTAVARPGPISMTLGGARVKTRKGLLRIGRDRGGLFGTRDGAQAVAITRVENGDMLDGRFEAILNDTLSGPDAEPLWARGLGPHDLGPRDLGPHALGPHDLGPHDLGPHDLGKVPDGSGSGSNAPIAFARYREGLDTLAQDGLVGVWRGQRLIACGNWTSDDAVLLQSHVRSRLIMRLQPQIWAS